MEKYVQQFVWIKEAWNETPAVITSREIFSFEEFPKWEDCPKDHLYIGILHNENLDKSLPEFEEIEGDLIYFVKHRMSGMLEITRSFEEFGKSEVLEPLLGLVPQGNQICKTCNQFATRIDGENCLDCNN